MKHNIKPGEKRTGMCPDCDGEGYSMWGGTDNEPEPEKEICKSCNGKGTVQVIGVKQ